VLPEIGIFKSDFTPACNRHDKCYTTLGTTYGQCNGNFLSDMRSACGKYNAILMPAEHLACMDSADKYYAAVQAWMYAEDPLPGLQFKAREDSRLKLTPMVGVSCGTTPENTTLFDASLITQINNTWQQYAHRQPTIFEFLDAVNSGNIVYDRTGWNNLLIQKAIAAASVTLPSVAYTFNVYMDTYTSLKASSAVPGTTYNWQVSRHGSLRTSVASELRIPSVKPQYDQHYTLTGFMTATLNNVRNMVVINRTYIEYGDCGPNPDLYCN